MGYAIEQRLRFIDCMLKYYGYINREEIIDFFGVGLATATRDIKLYQEKAPMNIVYRVKNKRYERSDIFERAYL